MRRIGWLNAILTVVLFVVPILVYPVSGKAVEHQTQFLYGVPFKWMTLQFPARGGRVFFLEGIFQEDVTFSFDFITALLDLIILYIVVRAVLTVFFVQHQKRKEKRRQ